MMGNIDDPSPREVMELVETDARSDAATAKGTDQYKLFYHRLIDSISFVSSCSPCLWKGRLMHRPRGPHFPSALIPLDSLIPGK